MIEEQAAAAASQGKKERKQRVYMWNFGLKKDDLEVYGTLLADFQFTNYFWKLWRNISADKRRYTQREH